MVRLGFSDTGQLDADAVVLLGGIGTQRDIWSPQVEALSTRFRVISVDLRGHGDFEIPEPPYSIQGLGEDVLRLLVELEVGSFSFCGLSLGGMVGIWLASQPHSPVNKLVVSGSPVQIRKEDWDKRAKDVCREGMKPLVQPAMDRWFSPEFRASNPDIVAQVARRMEATSPVGYAGCCAAIANLDIERRLADITAPTLLIRGDLDRAVSGADLESIAARLTGAGTTVRVVTIAGAAHLVNVESPGHFTAVLEEHLQGVDTTG